MGEDMKTDDPTNPQANWLALIQREGSEQAARAHLAARLREAAEQVERGTYPDVFGCKLPAYGLTGDDFMGEISVTLSYPWPG
jgi:hypothetical protein